MMRTIQLPPGATFQHVDRDTAMVHRPTLLERVRRALGFRYHMGEEPAGSELMAGWMQTRIRIDFSILDRLRLLTTGRLRIVVTTYTDAKVDTAVSRTDHFIMAPGER